MTPDDRAMFAMRAAVGLQNKFGDRRIIARCAKCGRFLAEIRSSANVLIKCKNCKTDNLINVVVPPAAGKLPRSNKRLYKT